MNLASSYAYTSFLLSSKCYNVNPGTTTNNGYYNAMYASYYRAYSALYAGYVNSDYSQYVGPTITSKYQGNVFGGSAAFWLGLACDGGKR